MKNLGCLEKMLVDIWMLQLLLVRPHRNEEHVMDIG